MSRLFSGWKTGDRTGAAVRRPRLPLKPTGQALRRSMPARPSRPGPTAAATPTAPATVSAAPAMPPLVPGYAISTSLSLAALPPPVVPEPRQAWAVKLWLASLLLLIGLSLLVLAVPERLLPGVVQQPQKTRQAAPAVPASRPPLPLPPLRPQVRPRRRASAIVTAVPALPPASAPRAEPRSRAAPTPTPTPAAPVAPASLPSGGGAACSEAMLAMNLCSKSSP